MRIGHKVVMGIFRSLRAFKCILGPETWGVCRGLRLVTHASLLRGRYTRTAFWDANKSGKVQGCVASDAR